MKSFSTAAARMLAVGVLMGYACSVAAQQIYPNRQIRIIVPFPPGGSNNATHLAAALFEILARVKMQHVPYKGSGPALIDLIGGQVQLYFSTAINFIPHVKSGKLRALAISGESRFSSLPNVPTFSEAGLRGLDLKSWYGILAPVGIPKETIDKLSTEIAKILASPDIREKLVSQGMAPLISTPDQFAALMKSESATLAKVIKAGNIKLE